MILQRMIVIVSTTIWKITPCSSFYTYSPQYHPSSFIYIVIKIKHTPWDIRLHNLQSGAQLLQLLSRWRSPSRWNRYTAAVISNMLLREPAGLMIKYSMRWRLHDMEASHSKISQHPQANPSEASSQWMWDTRDLLLWRFWSPQC